MDTSEYVIFSLNDQEFGIDIRNVKTIERPSKITRVPKAPDYIKGVINLRGEIIPIAETRRLLNFLPKDIDSSTRIIITEIGEFSMGLIADRAYEVERISIANIDISQKFFDNNNPYIKGVANIDGRLIIILDLEKMFSIQ
ncbi:chemotaxis protein CheW [Calorimonas adulescens]|jgi:CheW-like domain.|uniref:Purine-binding chemotaxis protein CheW n=1 Tax=Calorimonas adulescens TaxID=2606906 RepID=A0A5D8QFP9_9THEO|nr:chemotaxis protein CheW [Calorimonas adulescens]TZE83331.1 purine-binding chemotaxis protein CheW [Calorimonas adulescens]